MAINSFGDISGLMAYINGADSPVAVTGTVVDSITSQVEYEDDVGTVLDELVYEPTNPGGYVTYDPNNIKIGELPAFQVAAQSPATFEPNADSTFAGYNGPRTAVVVVQFDAVDGESKHIFNSKDTNGSGNNFGIKIATSDKVQANIQNGTYGSTIDHTTDPEIYVLRYDRLVTAKVYLDHNGTKHDLGTKSNEGVHGIDFVQLFSNNTDGASSTAGKVGIVAIYGKLLSDQEVADVTELAQTYIDTGTSPGTPGNPLTGFFDADTNDNDVVESVTWTVRREGDLEFTDAITTLSNATVATSPVTFLHNGRLTLLSATTADSGTVRCTVVSQAQTVVTDTLLIVEALDG